MFVKKKKPLVISRKEPFYKRRSWKIAFVIFGLFMLATVSFFAYIIAQGSRILDTDKKDAVSLIRTLTSSSKETLEDLNGYKEGRVNILFMGMGGANHPGGQLTDSIMVVSIAPGDHAYAMLSIPRDLYVPIADRRISAKINEAYYYGEKEKKGSGPTLAKKTVSNVLDIPIHYYFTVDFKGFEDVIDSIGGIDVSVEKAIYDPYYPDERMVGYSPFSIKAGQQHLDGKTALKFARSRETSSDFDRAARQQKVIGAVREKVMSLGFFANPKKLFDMVTILGDHVRTDLSLSDMKSLASIFKDLDGSKTVSKVLTNASDGPLVSDSSTGTYYLYPRGGNYKVIQQIAQNIFRNVEATKTSTNLQITYAKDLSDKALELKRSLEGYGYTISLVESQMESEKTTIYDYTGSSNESTASFIKKKINAPVVEKNTGKQDNTDIVILLGNDYLESVTKQEAVNEDSQE